jgi:KaiC/GvpD/RAD55 family RecA-like ATPase
MSLGDFREDLLRTLHARGGKTRERGDFAEFCCPRHEDRRPSAWLGEARWGCHACGFEEPLDTLASVLGVPAPQCGYTVEQYAEEKRFNLRLLTQWGVHTGQDDKGRHVVVIPYRDQDGNLLRNKLRGPRGAKWWEGRNRSTYLYGLDRLSTAAKDQPVFLVEGESDCHAAWEHDVLAVGVPGATSWRSKWARYLDGRTVYVWQEPDQGGEQFVRRLAPDLPTASVILANGTKDLADLHKREGNNFGRVLLALVETAVPIGVGRPPVTFDVALGPTLQRLIRDAQKPVEAVPTPLPSWNAVCRDEGGGIGLARGWHSVAAASTGHGKSLFALNVGASAIRHGERVCFVSLEMSEVQLLTRLLAIHSGIPVNALERGRRFDEAQARAAAAMLDRTHDETGGCLYVNRAPISRLEDILTSIRYQHEVHGCRFFVVDYLQLAWTGDATSLFENVQQVSHRVRQLVVELNVISLGLSQFNRETSKQLTAPTPQGLLGGSALENDSDQVILLDHSKYKRITPTRATVDVLVGKNRHGPQTRIPVVWDFTTLRLFEESQGWREINPEDRVA